MEATAALRLWERQEQGMTAVTLVPLFEIVTMTWVHPVSVINTNVGQCLFHFD